MCVINMNSTLLVSDEPLIGKRMFITKSNYSNCRAYITKFRVLLPIKINLGLLRHLRGKGPCHVALNCTPHSFDMFFVRDLSNMSFNDL